MNLLKKIFGSTTSSSSSNNSKTIDLTKARIQGRLHGFAWTIIEKRDPNFNGEKLKSESTGILMITSLAFAKDEECKVMTQLMDLLNAAKDSGSENKSNVDAMCGGLEGKLVVYKNLPPDVLLMNKKIE